MAPGFIRSTSLPLNPNHKKTSYHVRSASLPCRFHPFISNLEEQIHAVRSWATNPEGSSAWIKAGLAQIELLQIALEDFFQLSQTQETLRQVASVNQLLDDLLKLVDAYGTFVSNILTLKECHSNIQSAIRRCDVAGIASFLRSQRDVEKEIAQLASGLRGLSKCQHPAISSDAKEIEIAGIIVEAICATAFASMADWSCKTVSSCYVAKKLWCHEVTKKIDHKCFFEEKEFRGGRESCYFPEIRRISCSN